MVELKEKQITALVEKARKNKTETNNMEFKDARGGLPKKKLWKSISSFSHKPGGGIIIFGIEENRERGEVNVVGVLNLAILQEQLVNYMRDEIENCGEYKLVIIDYQDKSLLALLINEVPDEHKPCYYKKFGLPGGACIREGTEDRGISDEEMKGFIRNCSVFKFDQTEAKGASIDMISIKKMESFLEKSAQRIQRIGVSNNAQDDILKNLGIVDKFKGKLTPTIAGFLIFSKQNPQQVRDFSRYVIRCVRYKGALASTPIIDKQDILGTLDQQIDTMRGFILRNIPLNARISGTKRIERYEYPEEAVREIVANAVIHRDYTLTSTYTQVNIFSNRIEITNPGNLPPGVTVDNIKDAQFSRNETIASILKDMEYLEEYGRGIDIVFSKMQEYKHLGPIFKNMSNRFSVILLGSQFDRLNDRQVEIWSKFQNNRMITAKDCRNLFPNVSRATINNDLNKLVKIGLLSQKGSGMNTYYESIY